MMAKTWYVVAVAGHSWWTYQGRSQAYHRCKQQAIVCGLVLPGKQLVPVVQALH